MSCTRHTPILARLTNSVFALAFVGAACAQEAPDSPQIANLPLKSTLAQRAATVGKKSGSGGGKDFMHGHVGHAKPGPWGAIEYCTTYLEAPVELLNATKVSSLALDWRFLGFTEAAVEKLFASADLPAALRAELLDHGKWRRDGDTAVVTVSPELLEALPADARAAIYAVLARWPENRFHFEPNIVRGGNVEEWLQGSGLRPAIRNTIAKMRYRRGETWLFSDNVLILRMAESDAERLQIRKALSRIPSLVATVEVGPETNLEQLTEYWTCRRHFLDNVPFLNTAVATQELFRVDLVHLLPATVRKLLYTYPNETHGRGGYYPDCHWTSLNFFNYEPLERLAEPPLATAYTLENFFEVPAPERLGDVLFLMDKATGNAYHSCVYIADDIVFTKNGRSRTSPWVLMKLEDVRELYAIYQKTQTVTYRLKTLK